MKHRAGEVVGNMRSAWKAEQRRVVCPLQQTHRGTDPAAIEHARRLGIDWGRIEQLPFLSDLTVGVENELQTAVIGTRADVDLARSLSESSYFANATNPQRRAALERFLHDNPTQAWENSQVRIPRFAPNRFALDLFARDLRADKADPNAGYRSDIDRFLTVDRGVEYIRVPVSYLLRLSLADCLGEGDQVPAAIHATGSRLLDHFLNDNTSPEQFSSYVVAGGGKLGRAVATESAQRFLLTQLLTAYANEAFHLQRHGQEVAVYFSPLPPVRQRELNRHVSDAFYRELYMNPCLSGWARGEAKYRYMHLCHNVLSRSHFHTLGKLRDAGIIKRNLVVVPTLSNTSLANNGTHISLGSDRLTRAVRELGHSGRAAEKYLGDLAIKIAEHFLPLFINTYTAAPYRLDFGDFHPEQALGFLPHQLGEAHLHLLWRSWAKKADLSLFGQPFTPFGIDALDRGFAGLFGRRGDFVPDYRLLDYFVAVPSTATAPALDGALNGGERLKHELAEQGIFDRDMALYLPYRLREQAGIGFSGVEGRTYSAFASFSQDFGRAAELQALVTAFAYRAAASGRISHRDLPDEPFCESERRQFLFATALDLPFCYVRTDTSNRFLRDLLTRTRRVRASKYHHGYLKVSLPEYRLALLRSLRSEAADLAEALGVTDTLMELEGRLQMPTASAAGRLTQGILDKIDARNPLNVDARTFNTAAEHYYREELRAQQTAEAIALVSESCQRLDADADLDEDLRRALGAIVGPQSITQVFSQLKGRHGWRGIGPRGLKRLIHLLIAVIEYDGRKSAQQRHRVMQDDTAPIHRSQNG